MKIKINGLTYDDDEARCSYFVQSTQATLDVKRPTLFVAVVIVIIDFGNRPITLFGIFDYEFIEQSIADIMQSRSQWVMPLKYLGRTE